MDNSAPRFLKASYDTIIRHKGFKSSVKTLGSYVAWPKLIATDVSTRPDFWHAVAINARIRRRFERKLVESVDIAHPMSRLMNADTAI